MSFPWQRSRSSKKHMHRTPSGKTNVIYRRKRGAKHKCAICSSFLTGVPPRSKLKRLRKTQRRPERMFGGVLCSNCVQHLVKQKTRLETGAISREDVSLNNLKFIDKLSSH